MMLSGIKIICRPNSVDESIAHEAIMRDDYQIRRLAHRNKLLIDVGAYAGHVSLLAASLGMRVVAIEPLPENVAAIRANIHANGFDDRIRIVQGALGVERLFWNDPSEDIVRHRFVANSSGSPKSESLDVKKIRLDDVIGEEIHILKTDCEGGEWALGSEQAAQRARHIVGEFHPPGTFADFKAMFPAHTDVSDRYGFFGDGLRLFVFTRN